LRLAFHQFRPRPKRRRIAGPVSIIQIGIWLTQPNPPILLTRLMPIPGIALTAAIVRCALANASPCWQR
jgi:hypothetical protein